MSLTIIRRADNAELFRVHGLSASDLNHIITVWCGYLSDGQPRYTFVVNDVKQNG